MKIGLVAFATLAFATSASAATTAENPLAQDKAILNLKGLDLATAEGQERLAIRIDNAARAVCGDRVATVHLALEDQARECRAAVVADVRTQVEARLARAAGASSLRLAAR
ncbi:MAG: UrcA family protein [Sphingomonadales bacterium]|nr:UrcA family protein [Sphingomonadales bacterium]